MAQEKKVKIVTTTSVKEKPVAEKAAPKKVAAEKPVAEKTAPKKPVAKKPVAKKVTETVMVQAMGSEWDTAAVKEQVVAAYVAAGHKKAGISSLTVYIKPEERKAYYVVNGETGSVDI